MKRGKTAKAVRCVISKDGSFEVLSQDLTQSTTSHARGRIAESPLCVGLPVVDFSELRSRWPIEVDVAKLYERLHAAGLEYGPRFRTIRKAWGSGRGEALGIISVGDAQDQCWDSSFNLHPAVLDGALRLLAVRCQRARI